MHLPINVKSPNNNSKWQMGFNSAFKGLTYGRKKSDTFSYLYANLQWFNLATEDGSDVLVRTQLCCCHMTLNMKE
jgi:hypothetical protein